RQEADTHVHAEARATLTSWDGEAVASAYATGNTTLATNIGSDLLVDVGQINTGGVDAFTQFAGGAGGPTPDALLHATAIGNSFTGYVCSQCADAAAGGTVNQVNGGNVTATGSASATSSGAVFGTASAIGNSSTFITTTSRP